MTSPTLGVAPGSTMTGIVVMTGGEVVNSSVVVRAWVAEDRAPEQADAVFDQAVVDRIDSLTNELHPRIVLRWPDLSTGTSKRSNVSQDRAGAHAQARVLAYAYPDAVVVGSEVAGSPDLDAWPAREWPETLRGKRPEGWAQHDGALLGFTGLERRPERAAYAAIMAAQEGQ